MERERYRMNDLVLDVDSASLHRDTTEISLPALSFDLLVALARSAPKMLSADELIAQVWDGVAVADETLTQRVALLRRALGDSAKNPRYVRSIRGRGYALVPSVVPFEDEAPLRGGRRSAWVASAIVGILLLVTIGVATRRRAVDGPARTTTTSSTTVEEMVARADEYLARHQEEDNDRAVALYTKVLEAEADNLDALVGLSLGLSQRVTKFNRPATESDRALILADRALLLAPNLAAAHRARAAVLGSRGRVSGALEAYQQAAALDPEEVAASASAAYLMWIQGRLAEALETNLSVVGAADRLAYLHLQIASTLATLDFEPAAVVWFEKAQQLRSESIFTASTFAWLRLRQGRVSGAEELVRNALGQGVRNPELHMILGHIAQLRGEREQAKDHYQKALALNPKRSYAAIRLLVLERQAYFENEETITQKYRQTVESLHAARVAGDEWPGVAIDETLLHAAFGSVTEALITLDAAIDLGYRDADWLLLDPMLVTLRKNPAFFTRVERIRLAVASEREKVLRADWLPPDLLRP